MLAGAVASMVLSHMAQKNASEEGNCQVGRAMVGVSDVTFDEEKPLPIPLQSQLLKKQASNQGRKATHAFRAN